jgi:hypothetical protein
MENKTDPSVIARLVSGDELQILSAISDLRETGSPACIPLMAGLLLDSISGEVKKNVTRLLGELKDKESASVLVDTIRNETFLPVRKDLIAACWQNGLDYSPWFAQFVDWVIVHEMDIAFEAFTVIENLDHFPPDDIREAEIIKINRALQSATDVKKYLLTELRGIIA